MSLFERYAYAPSHPFAYVLAPLAAGYCGVMRLRRLAYRRGWRVRYRAPVPVIVVGNITVGGTGKTPLVLWLVEWLTAHGYRPGVVSRGYGGRVRDAPQSVDARSDPRQVGDEPVLLARRAACPVVVCRDRAAAACTAVRLGCDVLVSDDGLQHEALARDIEIIVIDGIRRLGNNRCLPAGPLREPAARMAHVDAVVCHGEPRPGEYALRLKIDRACALTTDTPLPLRDFAAARVHAMAGIGYPRRFFDQLRQHGLHPIEHSFPDHHAYRPRDLCFGDENPVLMTEKDAVKCQRFSLPNHWYVPATAEVDPALGALILRLLKRTPHG